MKPWDKIRPLLLAVGLVVLLGGLARAVLSPVPLERPLPPFAFPAAPPIPGWDAEPPDEPSEAFYRSEQAGITLKVRLRFIEDVRSLHISDPNLVMRMLPPGNLPLDVGMRTIVDAAGRLQANEKGAPLTARSLEIERAGGDFQGFWEDGREMRLSALIGATGRTAATSRQLMLNIYLPQFGMGRIRDWLFEGATLPDKRCILVEASILAPGMDASKAREQLRQAWSEWHDWCAPLFAAHCRATEKR